MPVKEFEVFIEKSRKDFEYVLQNTSKDSRDCIDWIMSLMGNCSNDFEEISLIENLREVYETERLKV